MDPDHLDIYGTAENFKEAFISFSQNVKQGGVLISKYELENETVFNTSKHFTYSVQNNLSNCFAKNITTQNGSYHFDVQMNDKIMSNFILNMGGLHNVENAVASIVAADYLEIEEEKIKRAVACFKGVKRRFEYIIKRDDFVLIDDYAHHPQELTALIDGVKKMFSGKKCIIIFQPHLFSRTKDFAEGFSNALSMADEVYLLPIYPARELPISGVSSEMLTETMSVKKVTCCSKEELIFNLNQKKSDFKSSVLIMAGAGDIDTMVLPVKNIFE
jgi:UDP-N-acetylmuramate--alanine ligase